jgi:hypothetical protein
MLHRTCAVVFCLFIIAVGVADADTPKYETPQATFDAAKAASVKGDWHALFGCCTDEVNERSVGTLIAFGEVIRAITKPGESEKEDKLVRDIEVIFKKHNLTPERLNAIPDPGENPEAKRKFYRDYGRLVKDAPAFVSEMIAALKASGNTKISVGLKDGDTLTDLTVKGDTAQAKVNGDDDAALTFKKTDGGWKIDGPIVYPRKAKAKS